MSNTTTTRLVTASVLTVSALTAGAAVSAGPAAADTGCTAHVLPGLPGAGAAHVISMNDSGLVGGEALGTDGNWHAVYWTHAGSDPGTGWAIHQLPSPLMTDFVADINGSGLMVATGADSSWNGVGYVYDPATGALTPLPGLGGGNDYDRRINDAGVVAGSSVDTHGVQHAVTWSPPYRAANLLPDVGASQSYGTRDYSHYKAGQGASGINNVGQVVGGTTTGAPFDGVGGFARQHEWRGWVAPLMEPVEWQPNGKPGKLPTNRGMGNAWEINDAGLVVGNIADAATGTPRPTAWSAGVPVDMGAPAGSFGNAYGLSSGGWAAGGYWNSDFTASHAFLWSQDGGFVTLPTPDGMTDTWSHTASDVLRQVGGQADAGVDGSDVAVIWQC